MSKTTKKKTTTKKTKFQNKPALWWCEGPNSFYITYPHDQFGEMMYSQSEWKVVSTLNQSYFTKNNFKGLPYDLRPTFVSYI